MSIYDFNDFRTIVRNQVQLMGQGRGAYAKMARAVGIHTATLSQILSGSKPLSMEQAATISDYFGFSEQESDYFLALVQLERAGNSALKTKIKKQIARMKNRKNDLSYALPTEHRLSTDQQLIFYSSWHYSAIRVLSSIPDYQTPEAISQKLAITRQETIEKVKFLLAAGLCVEKEGKILPGPSYTHLEATSPLISKHHANARLIAMQRHANLNSNDLAYSSLLSLSKKDAHEILDRLGEMIKKVNSIREKSQCEEMRLIGIDWIEI